MTHQRWSQSGVGYIDNVAKASRENIDLIATYIEGWRTEIQMIHAKWDHDHHVADHDVTTATVSLRLPPTTDMWALLLIHKGTANLLRDSDETWTTKV